MKQGLSLRVSQHLALTPQLQQSIRLLQLSTLELSQEVEQMLDDNPFLELNTDEAPREEFGLAQADAPVRDDDREAEFVAEPMAALPPTESTSTTAEAEAPATAEADEPTWDGDGTTEMVPDDGEWGGDAPARKNNLGDDGEMDATELARGAGVAAAHLHRQALALRLSAEDSAALRFLIESLNDDGYLEDPLEELAIGLAGRRRRAGWKNWCTDFTVALRLLHTWSPPGVGARTLGECLTLQLRALQAGRPARCAGLRATCAAHVCPAHGTAGAPRHETPGPGLWRQRRRSVKCGHRADHAAGAQAGPPFRGRGAQHRRARRDGGTHRARARRSPQVSASSSTPT
jgi:RNA polymerase sigma-54 factor